MKTIQLMDRVDPNIVIGIEVIRAKLESVKLHSFGNNVDAMLTDMEENYVNILDNHSTCESSTVIVQDLDIIFFHIRENIINVITKIMKLYGFKLRAKNFDTIKNIYIDAIH